MPSFGFWRATSRPTYGNVRRSTHRCFPPTHDLTNQLAVAGAGPATTGFAEVAPRSSLSGMRADQWMMVLLAAVPAVYAWWSGRSLRRSIDDPALPDLLLARQQRVMQVTLVVIIAVALLPAPTGLGIVIVLAVVAAQYPTRRGLYGDTWSLWQYLRFTTFSAIAFVGLWLFPLIGSMVVVQIARAWIPEPSTSQIALGFVLGIVAAVVYLVWHH